METTMSIETHDFARDGLHGYVARPQTPGTSGVLIVPTIFAVNPFVRHYADGLAHAGLTAAVCDLYCGLPLVTERREHVATPLFDSFLHCAARRVKELAVDLAGVLACSVLAWRLWLQAGITEELHTQTQVLHVPTAPFVYFMALTSAISTVVLVLRIARSLRGMVTRAAAGP